MRSLEFDNRCLNELLVLQGQNAKIISRILKLLIEITKTPFTGIGKPEPLKGTLSGFWSRRIDEKNRIVYKVEKEKILIISVLGHYESFNLN